jgi:DNA-directed DNA polymerase III PolC
LASHGLGWDELRAHSQGLICLSGGRRGWLNRFLLADNQAAASRYIAKLGGIFGESAFLSLELQRPEDQIVAREIIALGQRFGLPAVAVQPIYYLDPVDKSRLQLLKAIDQNIRLEAIPEPAENRSWLSPKEIESLFTDFPEAVAMAGQIVAQCQPALPESRPLWPALNLPDGETPESALAKEATAGLYIRYGHSVDVEVMDRLARELDAIKQSGFAPLFLVVSDIVHHARQIEVPVSTRGSVANSLVAYSLGITTVDPIANELLFERFLNPARANPPDIDLDFCSRRRDEVLAYVRQKYGADRVALVATISTLRPKSAVRETGKALGLSQEEIGQLVRMLPRGWHPDPHRRSKRQMSDLLDQLPEPRFRQVIESAQSIVGTPHHLSIHPGGLVITPGPLTDYVPIQWAPKGFLITQFDHQDLEILGLPKLDLLGIRALTVLADTAELVRQHYEAKFTLADIPLDDEMTGDILQLGETIGVFQCESTGARRTLRQLQARSVFDLAVANAFFKPGPATGGMAQTFVRRYRGEEAVQYLHPSLEPILASTQGVLLFQEQILRVATEIAGLSWEQADHLRRGMSKFLAGEMAAMQAQFIAGCCLLAPDGPGFSEDQAQSLWEQVSAFAGYGFNRGHATAYADVSYRSAFLKAHWPEAFFCARLADWGGFHHPAIYMAEAVRLGIPVRPPHVNHSKRQFTLSYASPEPDPRSAILWMGLDQVRGLRKRTIKTIVEQRQVRPFVSLGDLTERVRLQKKELHNLIRCGALDDLGATRTTLLTEAELITRSGSTRQMSFNFAQVEELPDSPAEYVAWERHILGQPVSIHPLTLAEIPTKTIPLSRLTRSSNPFPANRRLSVSGVRLPGWTGGAGFFLGDEQSYIIVRTRDDQKTPEPWQPLHISGRWLSDEWGSQWLQADSLEVCPILIS